MFFCLRKDICLHFYYVSCTMVGPIKEVKIQIISSFQSSDLTGFSSL